MRPIRAKVWDLEHQVAGPVWTKLFREAFTRVVYGTWDIFNHDISVESGVTDAMERL